MTAAGKLASDAFLPTGALDMDNCFPHDRSHHSSNRLPPENRSHPNVSNYSGNPPSILSPPPNVSPPSTLPPSNPNDILTTSPPGHPPPTGQQHHRGSLFPCRQTGKNQPAPYQSNPPDVSGASFLYRSVSADAASAPPTQVSNHLVQRLAQQNALIRESWEAERNYLEANRRRAEEVYQEERVIMEEVREAWENEKAALLRENQTLKERIQRLEGENTTLRTVAAQQGVHAPGILSPPPTQRGGRVDAATESTPTGQPGPQNQSHQGIAPVADPASLPPGLDGASRRPHRASPGSSGASPMGQPESSPFVPLDPRMQPQTQNPKDFLASSKEKGESGPAIDVRELDSKLDGIPLKATAVQRFTFGESSKSSPATSPPAVAETDQPPQSRQGLKRLSSKDQTIQALHAEESRRLTMHAGHTPNHSLSLFPTMSVADGSTSATRDDDSAPSQGAPSPPREQVRGAEQHGAAEELNVGETAAQGHENDPPHDHDGECEDPEEQLEPMDDVRLKGPLMVKNIPAQDEIFWDQVNKKLEPISQGQDALPSVMRACNNGPDGAGPSGPQNLALHQGVAVAPVGGDASHDPCSGIEGTDEEVSGKKGVEGEVPLKIRTTTNFGAPFGMA